MREEVHQLQLSQITVAGTAELPLHLQYRQKIATSQRLVDALNNSQPSKSEIFIPPDRIITEVELTLHKLGIPRFGYSKVLQEQVFENNTIPGHNRVLIIVIPLDYHAMISAPSVASATEILKSYVAGGDAVYQVVKAFHALGLPALGHHPMGSQVEYHQLLLPPHAYQAGLGEQGRTGLFIDYEYGPLVRLAAVTFSSELPVLDPQPRGVTEFCKRCRYCISKCPPRALPPAKYQDYLYLKDDPLLYSVDRTRCFPYFAKHRGCGRCIAHCVLANPELSKITERMTRIEHWYSTWVKSGMLAELYGSNPPGGTDIGS